MFFSSGLGRLGKIMFANCADSNIYTHVEIIQFQLLRKCLEVTTKLTLPSSKLVRSLDIFLSSEKWNEGFNSLCWQRLLLGCGFRSWRPKWLQAFAKPSMVVFLMMGIRLMNKLSDSYLSSTLSTTEKHYGFKTKEMSLVRYIR